MEIEQEIATIKDVFHHEVVSQAREEYNSHYKDEIKLNMDFNQYVVNYKAAYEGRNTVKDQIIGAISKKGMAERGKQEYFPTYIAVSVAEQLVWLVWSCWG